MLHGLLISALTKYVMVYGVLELPLSNGKVALAVEVERSNRSITPCAFQNHVRTGGRFERTPAIDGAWWSLITRCWDDDPEVRPSFEEICALITEAPDDFASQSSSSRNTSRT